ncbi:MAG TPA: prefoldin subunit alpha, partial [Candidatus Lokiarchaeia archaeon]
ELNNRIYEFRLLREQRDVFQTQLEFVNSLLTNLMNTKITIENLKNVKDGDEILIPVGGYVNLNAIIKNPEKIMLYVSHDVMIEKDLNGSIEFLDKLITEHNEQMQNIAAQVQKLDATLMQMSQSFQKEASQQQ